mgnify:CR=1 FL=1
MAYVRHCLQVITKVTTAAKLGEDRAIDLAGGCLLQVRGCGMGCVHVCMSALRPERDAGGGGRQSVAVQL